MPARLWSGGRFAAAVRSGVPPGVMAAAGRKKYGTANFNKHAAAARRAAARHKK